MDNEQLECFPSGYYEKTETLEELCFLFAMVSRFRVRWKDEQPSCPQVFYSTSLMPSRIFSLERRFGSILICTRVTRETSTHSRMK